MSKKRLGRGLDALLSSDVLKSTGAAASTAMSSDASAAAGTSGAPVAGIEEVAIADVVRSRYQPRQDFDEEGLKELATSIKVQGLMQPIVIRPRAQGGYELIAGERRWRAAQIAGLQRIPAMVRDVSDAEASAMALIENIQREDLNPLEEAVALQRLQEEFQLTQQQVADAVGKSRVAVTNTLRLLNLCQPVRELLIGGEIEMGHARALLSLDPLDQERLARVVATKRLSVRATEALVRSRQQPPRKQGAARAKDNDILILERELSDRVGAPVSINADGKGKGGKLVIGYSNLDELEGILAHLK